MNKSLSWQPKLILIVTLILHPPLLLPLLPPPPPQPHPSFIPSLLGGRRGGCGREVGEVLGKRLVANQIGAISLHPCLTALLGLKASGLTDWVTDLLDHRLTVTPLILTLLLHTPPLRPLLPPPPPPHPSFLPSLPFWRGSWRGPGLLV